MPVKKPLAHRCKLSYRGCIKAVELQAIVDAAGKAEVSKVLGWSERTLRRKLCGKSAITKAEGFLVEALFVVKDVKETSGRTIG